MTAKNVSVGVCNERHKALNDDVGEMKSDIKLIKDNHLVHIQKSITELQTSVKLTKWLVPILVGLITVGVQIIFELARG